MTNKIGNDWYAMSNASIMKALGSFIRHHRQEQKKTQGQQSLSVNGKRTHIDRDDFLTVARQMGIKKSP